MKKKLTPARERERPNENWFFIRRINTQPQREDNKNTNPRRSEEKIAYENMMAMVLAGENRFAL